MPSKDTKVIAVRVPLEIHQAIADEADGRGISINQLLNLRLAADYAQGNEGRKTTRSARKGNQKVGLRDG